VILDWYGLLEQQSQILFTKMYAYSENNSIVAAIEYQYNDQGYRTQKVITEGTSIYTYEYELQGSCVIRETLTKTVNGLRTESYELIFLYDVNNTHIGFLLDGIEYFYLTDLLGNIISILAEDGTEMVKYEYDAYGNIINSPTGILSDINPYTYCSYRYDFEIGMYYLNSRYYNPQSGLFISSDGLLGQQGDIQSTNMYAYCENDPIGHFDPFGNIVIRTIYPNSPIYLVKYFFYLSVNGFLSLKRYTLSKAMFNYGYFKSNASVSYSNIMKMISNSASNSSELKNKIQSILNRMSSSSTKIINKPFSVSFLGSTADPTSMDLYYSLHQVSGSFSGTKQNGKWILSVTISDIYNFEKWMIEDCGFSFGYLANNFGYYNQLVGFISPYTWSVTFSMIIG
jgi:RHS repeat-associated protein